MNYWKIVFWILGVLPIGFSASILSFYFHAASLLGRLPHYNQPDPKQLDIYVDYAPVIDLTAAVWLCSFPIWALLSIIYLVVKRKEANWRFIALSAATHLLVALITFSGIVEWYVD